MIYTLCFQFFIDNYSSKILQCSLSITSAILMCSVTPWSIIHFSSLVSLWPLLGLFSTSGEKLKIRMLKTLGFELTKVVCRCGY